MIEKLQSLEGDSLAGELKYNEDELSFDFIPQEDIPALEASLSVAATLQVSIDPASKKLLYAWGYFPLDHLKKSSLSLPSHASGRVSANAYGIESGITYPSSLDETKSILVDPIKQLLAIGDVSIAPLVEIAHGVYLGIDENGNWRSLWLHWL